MRAHDYVLSPLFFYLAWIIIPILLEFVPAVFNCMILIRKGIGKKEKEELVYIPQVTVIIPVYNSSKTLYNCIKSIAESDYPTEKIFVFLVDNGGSDNSFEVFEECQKTFTGLNMNWIVSQQGKSKALNMALFNSVGEYVIHIDSDGVLDKEAIYNMISYFEHNSDVHCVTGSVLIDPDLIEQTEKRRLRILQKIEFLEYAQAFLAGRNFESEFNSIYTVSGAFSAFRKSTIMKTKLYNTDTICEDTHITFQVREILKQKVSVCTDAYFFVDPIEDLNRLYTQRQRWQRGELEVAHMFTGKKQRNNLVIKLLLYDHTFAFPRLIWFFALFCFSSINYTFRVVTISLMLIYAFSVFTSILYYSCILLYLRRRKELRRYYLKKWYLLFITPFYRSMLFIFRFAGIINSIASNQVWKSRTLTQEKEAFWAVVKGDLKKLLFLLRKKESVVQDQIEE